MPLTINIKKSFYKIKIIYWILKYPGYTTYEPSEYLIITINCLPPYRSTFAYIGATFIQYWDIIQRKNNEQRGKVEHFYISLQSSPSVYHNNRQEDKT